MNKTELIAAVAENTGMAKTEAKKAVDAAIEALAAALAAGDRVALPGLGTFNITERGERIGKNPRTGEQITIAAKKVIKFKPSFEVQ